VKAVNCYRKSVCIIFKLSLFNTKHQLGIITYNLFIILVNLHKFKETKKERERERERGRETERTLLIEFSDIRLFTLNLYLFCDNLLNKVFIKIVTCNTVYDTRAKTHTHTHTHTHTENNFHYYKCKLKQSFV